MTIAFTTSVCGTVMYSPIFAHLNKISLILSCCHYVCGCTALPGVEEACLHDDTVEKQRGLFLGFITPLSVGLTFIESPQILYIQIFFSTQSNTSMKDEGSSVTVNILNYVHDDILGKSLDKIIRWGVLF